MSLKATLYGVGLQTDRYHAAIEEVLDKSDAAWRQLLREEPDDTSEVPPSGP